MAARHAVTRLRRPVAFGVVVGLGYLAVMLAVLAIEVSSESQKLDRGGYTDTADALVFSRLVTMPGSLAVPATTQADRSALNARATDLGTIALLQAAFVGLAAGAVRFLGEPDASP